MFSIVIDVGALFWGVLGFVGAESGVFAEAEREIEPGGADEVEPEWESTGEYSEEECYDGVNDEERLPRCDFLLHDGGEYACDGLEGVAGLGGGFRC